MLDPQKVDIALLDITLDRPLEGGDPVHRINGIVLFPLFFFGFIRPENPTGRQKTLPMVKPSKPEDLYMVLEVALTTYWRATPAGSPP